MVDFLFPVRILTALLQIILFLSQFLNCFADTGMDLLAENQLIIWQFDLPEILPSPIPVNKQQCHFFLIVSASKLLSIMYICSFILTSHSSSHGYDHLEEIVMRMSHDTAA